MLGWKFHIFEMIVFPILIIVPQKIKRIETIHLVVDEVQLK